jgi:hypothetical protein
LSAIKVVITLQEKKDNQNQYGVRKEEKSTGSLHPPVKDLTEQSSAGKETFENDCHSAHMQAFKSTEKNGKCHHKGIVNQPEGKPKVKHFSCQGDIVHDPNIALTDRSLENDPFSQSFDHFHLKTLRISFYDFEKVNAV